ncbi:uncharacterized protein YdeI (YjbR/CyaY-like superfamily) [Gillisia sp. Hel_I_86]|uniref:YdeI/OmpD-associated family protein n=1 Tax=Gillisia sp. Hel_I_86 TaxID=1249981 RepID=UPI00119C3383|nr:DUF1801 domain-containing protein [Gillisia sp. Hel_I_86]TVZ27436.1 uncharacterized protein YdeI (YjbR/CyaY-like superfamily) [Gillisia sp. Hel_I_86]
MAKIENVGQYIDAHPKWKAQLLKLRQLLLSCNLSETIKWGAPVYTKDSKNLIGIGAFKNHFGLWFFQGALLQKNTKLLVNAQEGKTQAMRQIKFDETSEIHLDILKRYVEETISLHDQGKTAKLTTPKKVEIPNELQQELNANIELNKAFDTLTPGKQKEYSVYIIEAKRKATKQNRIDKIIPLILAGKSLNDKYKNC